MKLFCILALLIVQFMKSIENLNVPKTDESTSLELYYKPSAVGTPHLNTIEPKICGIYKITSPTGRVYIGQSRNIYVTLNYRYKNYKCETQKLVYRSVKKYGWNSHTFEVIEICPKEHLNYYEVYYIWIFNSFNSEHGMNLTVGGKGTSGYKFSEDAKKTMSLAKLGKKHSAETKEKMGKSHRGRKLSPEVIKNMIEGGNNPIIREKKGSSMRGKKHKQESIEKCRMAKLGSKNPNFGKPSIAKIILNTETGIFYFGVKNASDSTAIKECTLRGKLLNISKNNTSFICV